jgi:hypothetical protein
LEWFAGAGEKNIISLPAQQKQLGNNADGLPDTYQHGGR